MAADGSIRQAADARPRHVRQRRLPGAPTRVVRDGRIGNRAAAPCSPPPVPRARAHRDDRATEAAAAANGIGLIAAGPTFPSQCHQDPAPGRAAQRAGTGCAAGSGSATGAGGPAPRASGAADWSRKVTSGVGACGCSILPAGRAMWQRSPASAQS
jgi:hypothetical protein